MFWTQILTMATLVFTPVNEIVRMHNIGFLPIFNIFQLLRYMHIFFSTLLQRPSSLPCNGNNNVIPTGPLPDAYIPHFSKCTHSLGKIKTNLSKISTPVFFVDISCPNCPIFSNFTPIYIDKLLGIALHLKTLYLEQIISCSLNFFIIWLGCVCTLSVL